MSHSTLSSLRILEARSVTEGTHVTIETNLDNDALSMCLRVGTRRAASRSPCDSRRCGWTRVLDRSVSGDGWCGHAQHAGGAGSKPDVSTLTTTKSLAAFISSALLPAPTRLRVLLAHRGFAHVQQGAGCRWSGCREVCGGTSRFGGPVDCYQIVTGKLSYFPLPSFVTLFALGGRGDLGEPVTNRGQTQHAAALLDRRGRRLLGHIAPPGHEVCRPSRLSYLSTEGSGRSSAGTAADRCWVSTTTRPPSRHRLNPRRGVRRPCGPPTPLRRDWWTRPTARR